MLVTSTYLSYQQLLENYLLYTSMELKIDIKTVKELEKMFKISTFVLKILGKKMIRL